MFLRIKETKGTKNKLKLDNNLDIVRLKDHNTRETETLFSVTVTEIRLL